MTERRWAKRALGVVLLLASFALGALMFGGGGSKEEAHVHAAEAAIWTCSMHPQIRQPEPGKCPICGMDLVPVTSGADQSAPDRVVFSERARALAKLRTAKVERRSGAAAELRLLGRVEADESSLRAVTAWTAGRIDRLHVRVTGEKVRAGQLIATMYSPEVFAAHQDLLVAHRQVARLADAQESAKRAATAALDAARERLRLLGVPEDELEALLEAKEPTRALPIRSPFAGTVIERMATEGAYVMTGMPLFKIANLGSVWLQLDAYESDLATLAVGQTVEVRVEALPGERFEGRVSFLDPTLDPRRRTSKVRVELDNKGGRLRPGMFAAATVRAKPSEGSPLVIPATAPLFTGRRAVVYVELEDEAGLSYQARVVRLGPRVGEEYPVVAGLSEGERVVARGAFAIDADLQIRGGASMMSVPDDRAPGAYDAIVTLDAKERARLAPVVEVYLAVQTALAADDLEGAKRSAHALTAARTIELRKDGWPEIAARLEKHARQVEGATDLEAARSGFEGLSGDLGALLARFGNPSAQALHQAFCPMAMGSEGAAWFQRGTTIDNSYFGAAMRTCGEVKQAVAPGGYLPGGPRP